MKVPTINTYIEPKPGFTSDPATNIFITGRANKSEKEKNQCSMIPQKTIDKMEKAERRFYYAHESFIRYGKSYDKLAIKNATREMRYAERELRKIYRSVIEIYRNGS